jgi:hypothetical protein
MAGVVNCPGRLGFRLALENYFFLMAAKSLIH